MLDAAPGRQRQLLVQVQDLSGEPVDLRERPEVSLRTAGVDLGIVPVTPTGTGTFAATVTFPEGWGSGKCRSACGSTSSRIR